MTRKAGVCIGSNMKGKGQMNDDIADIDILVLHKYCRYILYISSYIGTATREV
ncbi:hypothetical protein [Anaplasma phagocytophilum]|uniref:hypothetical protein n=1 Tax=Anaplasma phagocytophilum TaxID=948 RepID=UPI000AB7D771|nr:hypothetical protein [Anaplasma phagocytophilum]